MRCFKCKKISLKPICKDCQKLYLIPIISKREISNLEVISIFDYHTVADIIKSKYHISGYRLYKFLAKEYIKPVLKEFAVFYKKDIYLIPIDESLNRDYSLISLILHHASKDIKNIKPLYHSLKAKNKISYAGKSLEFRLNNPRDFKYYGPKNINAILIDDLITTGTTIQEAYIELKRNAINVEFALTLANVKKGLDF